MSHSPAQLTIAVDWSARSAPSPKRPSPDAIWIAHNADRINHPPEYLRTRHAATHRITELLAGHPGPALVGFDFPLGYPLAVDRTPVMPIGQNLCARLASLIDDKPDNRNNRFDVAEQLNAAVQEGNRGRVSELIGQTLAEVKELTEFIEGHGR